MSRLLQPREWRAGNGVDTGGNIVTLEGCYGRHKHAHDVKGRCDNRDIAARYGSRVFGKLVRLRAGVDVAAAIKLQYGHMLQSQCPKAFNRMVEAFVSTAALPFTRTNGLGRSGIREFDRP